MCARFELRCFGYIKSGLVAQKYVKGIQKCVWTLITMFGYLIIAFVR
jgi:hypothetical protein